MQQTQTGKVRLSRLRGRLHAWFSKPANIILLVFLIALTVLTLYPLLSLLVETVTVHLGKEARAAKLPVGAFTWYHFQRVFASKENDYSWIKFYRRLLSTLAVSVT